MSDSADLAYITPAVLTRAIERSGLTRVSLEALFDIHESDIRTWESGEAHPPFALTQKLACALDIPFGLFWLSAPPEFWPEVGGKFPKEEPPQLVPLADVLQIVDEVEAHWASFHRVAPVAVAEVSKRLRDRFPTLEAP